MHSVLIVGCGSIGERHLRCFQQTGRAAVTACDTNAALLQRIQSAYRVPLSSDPAAALACGFSVVVICTPAPSHVPLACAALERGSHVLIEKPLSHSLTGLDRLARLHAQSGRQVAVAYVYHLFPALVAAKAFLQREELGPVRQVTVTSGQPFAQFRPAYATTYYRSRDTGGGAIQDALTHLANWVESVVGPADSLLCDCAHLALPDVEVEDTVHVAARHGAVLVSYTLNQFQAPNETTFQFNTTRGSVRVELHRQRWGIFREGDADWSWQACPVPDRDSHFTAQAHAFLDQVEGVPSRLCTLEAATQTLRFNLAALASAERGTRVACRDLS